MSADVYGMFSDLTQRLFKMFDNIACAYDLGLDVFT